MELAFDRYRLAEESWSDLRRRALEDHKFKQGEQWEPEVYESRRRDARPCLTMNRLRQFCRQVTNEQRQMRPSIQVDPLGDDADIATAEVLEGLCRHVENQSSADIAYDHGFESMTTGGFGYWRIITDYPDDDSDEQEIYIKRVLNPFMVYFDPRVIEPDWSDALYCFIVEDMSIEMYRAEYPKSSLASLLEFTSSGDMTPGWVSRDGVRVAEYFYVELEPGEKGHRPKRTVKWAKINAVEILEKQRDFPCRWIPIVPCLGDESIVEGRRDLVGIIRDARDPQRMYNFQISAAAEAIALAPKSPWVAGEGQIEGHEGEWRESNRRNTAVLTYKPISSTSGQPMPPPQRQTAEPPIGAMAAMIKQADNDLKAVTGIYDASLGQQGPEQSGKAVLLRQQQSNIANLNYTDNQGRAIRFTGRILLDMFPRVYKQTQIKRIIKPDGETQHVGIVNSQESDDTTDDAMEELDIQKVFDIGTGRYDVTVSVGPTYESKRKESLASEVALISAYPAIMPIAGDLLVRNMDWPGAPEIADRLKRMLPPQLQELTGDPNTQMQQLQGKLQQMMQQNTMLAQALQQSQQVIGNRLIESQSKENIAALQEWTKLNVAIVNASKDTNEAGADREAEMLQAMMGQAHEHGMQAVDATHEMAMQGGPQGPTQQAQPAAAMAPPQAGGPSPTVPGPGQAPQGPTP